MKNTTNPESPRRVMLIGETMGLLIADSEGELSDINQFTMAIAGAEFNVAVGLSRLTIPVTFLTKLGTDSIGRRIERHIISEGLNAEDIVWSDSRSTGLMFKGQASSGDPEIDYYRRGAAASTFSPTDLPEVDWEMYSTLHLTGILPALSASTLNLCRELIADANSHGVRVVFDPNLRPSLWPSKQEMVETINSLALQSDIVLPGINEGIVLTGESEPEAIANWYLSRGVPLVVVKLGEAGAYIADTSHNEFVKAFVPREIVDSVGAGDGFAAGLISGLVEGDAIGSAVERAAAIGAIQLQNRGDNEGLPTRSELFGFMKDAQRYSGPSKEN